MKSKTFYRSPLSWLFMLLVWSALGSAGLSQSASRRQMIEEYLDYKKSNASFYDSPPIYHLVPNSNTVSYAANITQIDTKLTPSPSTSGTSNVGSGNITEIELTGSTISPHIAMSLKKIGLGFSAERGNRNSFFRHQNASQGTYIAQESTMTYSGIGLNFSYLFYQSRGKFLSISTILGWKNFSARHQWSQYLTFNRSVGGIENPYKSTVRYSIERYQSGLNANLALLKSFHLVPWVDFQFTESSDALAAYETAQRSSTIDPIFNNDIQLFWLAEPNARYGLDIAIHLGNFELRLGGILGTFANLNPLPESMSDDSINISLSWDHKAD